jgi:hypothetical protein
MTSSCAETGSYDGRPTVDFLTLQPVTNVEDAVSDELFVDKAPRPRSLA